MLLLVNISQFVSNGDTFVLEPTPESSFAGFDDDFEKSSSKKLASPRDKSSLSLSLVCRSSPNPDVVVVVVEVGAADEKTNGSLEQRTWKLSSSVNIIISCKNLN